MLDKIENRDTIIFLSYLNLEYYSFYMLDKFENRDTIIFQVLY